MQQFLLQFWQAIGWNGISAIAALISSFAALISAIAALAALKERNYTLQLLPPQKLLLKPMKKTRKRKRNRKHKPSRI
jgi:hypothetical protein